MTETWVPTKSIVLIKDSQGGQEENSSLDIRPLNRIGVVKGSGKSAIKAAKEYEVDHIMIDNEELFEQSEMPLLLQSLIDGVDCSLLIAGTSSSFRSSILLGGSNSLNGHDDSNEPASSSSSSSSLGLFYQTASQLFDDLAKKYPSDQLGRGKMKKLLPDFSQFQLCISLLEIYDEKLYDLLDRNNELELLESSREGVHVSNLTASNVRSPDELVSLFTEGSSRRRSGRSEVGSMDQFSQLIIRLQLRQAEGEIEDSLLSNFWIVELPATDRLAQESSSLQLKEGPTLNAGLLGLRSAVQEIAKSIDNDEEEGGIIHDLAAADWASSIGLSILEPCFSLNTARSMICTLSRSDDPDVCEELLGLVSNVRRLVSLPNVNDKPARLHIAENRSKAISRGKVLSSGSPKDMTVSARSRRSGSSGVTNEEGSNRELVIKLHQLEGTIIEQKKQMVGLSEAKEKMVTKYSELKSEYTALAESSNSGGSKLKESEKEKLKLSQALIDLKLTNTKLQEELEVAKYQLSSKLLSSENSIMEAESKSKIASDAISKLTAEIEDRQKANKEFEIEFVAIKRNLLSVRAQLEAEQAKSEELSLEVVNLINAKKKASQDLALLSAEHDRTKLELDLVRAGKSNNNSNNSYSGSDGIGRGGGGGVASHRAKLEKEELMNEVERLKTEALQRKVEADKARLDFESQKMSIEKRVIESNREKEEELKQLREREDRIMAELKSIELKYSHIAVSLEEAEAERSKNNGLIDSLMKERDSLNEQLMREMSDHRSKVLELMNNLSRLGANSDVEVSKVLNKLKHEICTSFERKEKDLTDQLLVIRGQQKELIHRNRDLYASWKGQRTRLEEAGISLDSSKTSGSGPSPKGGLSRIKSVSQLLENEEVNTLRTKVERQEKEIAEKEARILELSSEAMDLKDELEQQNSSQSISPIGDDTDRSSERRELEDALHSLQVAERKIGELKEDLLEKEIQLEEAQRGQRGQRGVDTSAMMTATTSGDKRAQRENLDLSNQILDLRVKLASSEKQRKEYQSHVRRCEVEIATMRKFIRSNGLKEPIGKHAQRGATSKPPRASRTQSSNIIPGSRSMYGKYHENHHKYQSNPLPLQLHPASQAYSKPSPHPMSHFEQNRSRRRY